MPRESLLDSVPDDALLEAVLSNLWAKMDADFSNEEAVFSSMSIDRKHIYAIYAVTGALRTQQPIPESIRPYCEEALHAMGTPGCAALLSIGNTEAYLRRFDEEHVKALMAVYIRAHATGFCDDAAEKDLATDTE